MQRAMARSLLVSADMAHALHPNYADQHEPSHQPMLNKGLVIKSNVNQSYATDGETAACFEELLQRRGLRRRSGSWCAAICRAAARSGRSRRRRSGIQTVDVGAPMLSMHSCREMCGTMDVYWAVETYRRVMR